jgi:prepilin peptidase CpaA
VLATWALLGIPLLLVVPLALLVGAAVWDLAKREIPDAFPLALVAWAVGTRLVAPEGFYGHAHPPWWPLAAGLGVGLLIGFGAFALGWMGGGDGKLLAGLGAVLGPVGLLVVLPGVALVGGLTALRARKKGVTEIPYGPAVALGYLLAILI